MSVMAYFDTKGLTWKTSGNVRCCNSFFIQFFSMDMDERKVSFGTPR